MKITKTETHLKQLKDFYLGVASENELNLAPLFDKMEAKSYKRKFHLVREGDLTHKYYFMLKGCLRMYYVNEQGQEVNVHFVPEGLWMTFFTLEKEHLETEYYVECIEDCEVLEVDRTDFYDSFMNQLDMAKIYIKRTEKMLLNSLLRTRQLMSASAEERYLHFVENNKSLALRLPDVQIAKYLGVTPAFLSKMKKRITLGK